MKREDAIDEYWAAINEHKPEDPATKQRIRKAREGLMPFLEKRSDQRFSNNALPLDLVQRFEAKTK